MSLIDYQIISGDRGGVINIDTTNEPFSVALPLPEAGFNITIKDAGGNALQNPITILRKRNIGAELLTNGDFTTNLTGWTTAGSLTTSQVSTLGGAASLTRTGSNSSFYQAFTTVAGAKYKVEYDVVDYSGTAGGIMGMSIYDGSGTGGTVIIPGNFSPTTQTFGRFTVYFTALSTTSTINFNLEVQASFTVVIDNVSVKSYPQVKVDEEDNEDIINKSYGSISYISDGTDWFRVSGAENHYLIGGAGLNIIAAGGTTPMQYLYIPIEGSISTNHADLSVTRDGIGACSSSTRGVFGGGSGPLNTIDYITMRTLANAIDFGDLTVARIPGGTGNSTRGLFAGYAAGALGQDVIDYITIASTGNATDFGDLTVGRNTFGALSSTTRAVFAGGDNGVGMSVMDYVTIATPGNATSFGSLTSGRELTCGVSNGIRGVWAGAFNPTTAVIDYITIASTGNATSFGSLTSSRYGCAGGSNKLRGVYSGGGPSSQTTIDYINITLLSNATTFGNLSVGKSQAYGVSTDHGGL